MISFRTLTMSLALTGFHAALASATPPTPAPLSTPAPAGGPTAAPSPVPAAAPAPVSPAAPATAPIVQGDLGKKIDDWLTKRAESGFSGLVLVEKGREVLLKKGYGLADREKKIPMAPGTVFSIGSITKQFTASAILKLEMMGKLTTSDTVATFFPEAPADKKKITLHQLLTHTSGFESDFAGDFEPVGRDEYVRRILRSKLRSEPGTAYWYANSGYSLLAAIVEIVSKRPYETFLRETLLLPAGMTQTGYKAPAWDPGSLAVGYRGAARWGTILEKPWADDGPYWALRGNGGIHTTLEELLKWHHALEGETVLSKEAKAKLFKPWVAEDPSGESHYGYGWAIQKSPEGKTLITHNGGDGVFSADLRRYVDDRILIVTFSNSSDVKATELAAGVSRLALGLGQPDPAPPPLGAAALPASAFDGSPALRRARSFFDAFSSGDPAKMSAWRKQNMAPDPKAVPEEQRDARYKEMFANLGKLVPIQIKGETDEELTVLARADAEEAVGIGFMLTAAPERKVRGLKVKVGN